MNYSIQHGPVFSILEIDVSPEDIVVAQPNSMLSMSSGIRLSASVGRRGSGNRWWSGAKNLLGGENFFTAEFRAKAAGEKLTLAPDTYGDILPIELAGAGGLYLTRGSYLANIGECELRVKYSGMKGLMSRKGLFLLHAQGVGTLFCQAYGAVISRDLDDGETFYLDNRFAVAFSDTIAYQLVKATNSLKDSLMSGEGLVNRYTGPGRLYYQTRSKPSGGLLGRAFDAAF